MEHDWHLSGTYGDRNRYVCSVCRVVGHSNGVSWPPLRIGRAIHPAYATCEGAKEADQIAELKKYGLWEEPETLDDKIERELRAYGIT